MMFDVQSVIDRQKGRIPQSALLAIITLIMIIDGFDTHLLGTVAPAITKDFNEPAVNLTSLFFFQAIGMAIGSLCFGVLADRVGRKKLIILCLAGFGILNVGASAARTLSDMTWLRSIGGFFIAGIIPVGVALLTEFAPPARRSFYVTIIFAGYAAGAAASALAAMWVLPVWGWRGCFVVGGFAPFVLLPILATFVEESIQFRARRKPNDPSISASIQRIDPTADLSNVSVYYVGSQDRGPSGRDKIETPNLLSRERRLLTLILWITFFIGLGKIALLTSWIPTLFVQSTGISVASFARYSLIAFVGSMVGSPATGLLMDRAGGNRVLAAIFLLEAIALALLGVIPFGTPACLALFFIWGFCQAGGQGGINALCAQIYPRCRNGPASQAVAKLGGCPSE